MSRKFDKLPIQKSLSLPIFFFYLLPFTAGLLMACGQDVTPAASPDEIPVRTVSKEITAPLPSEEHLRAFTVLQNLTGEDFTLSLRRTFPATPFLT